MYNFKLNFKYFHKCVSRILSTGGGSASVHAGIHPPGRRLLQWTVRSLLECILVWRLNSIYICLRQAWIRLSTLASKPWGDVTRSPKQGCQWPHKKELCRPKNLKNFQYFHNKTGPTFNQHTQKYITISDGIRTVTYFFKIRTS